jgi:hypothetical protein
MCLPIKILRCAVTPVEMQILRAAGELLNIQPSTLKSRMKKLGIKKEYIGRRISIIRVALDRDPFAVLELHRFCLCGSYIISIIFKLESTVKSD